MVFGTIFSRRFRALNYAPSAASPHRQKFADRFGLDARALQDWEQGRRVPDRAARDLLTVIDSDPGAVVRALGK